MFDGQLLFFALKVLLTTVASFCAILLLNKTRDSSCLCFIAGIIIDYAGQIYALLVKLKIFFSPAAMGGKTGKLLFIILESFFSFAPICLFTAGILIMLYRHKTSRGKKFDR